MTQETPTFSLDKFNPWLEIWYRPRTTIRRIVQLDPKRDIYIIAALFGYAQFLERAGNQAMGDNLGLLGVLGLGLILGPIGGFIGLAIGTFLFGFVARRLGGEAEGEDITAALAWSQVPTIFSLVLWAIQILIFREELFTSTAPRIEANPSLALLFVPFAAMGILIGVWQLIMTVLTMAEVNRFPIWKSILTLLLPSILLLLLFGVVLLT